MKWKSLVLLAFTISAPLCHGQDAPAASPAAPPVTAPASAPSEPVIQPDAPKPSVSTTPAPALALAGSYVLGPTDVITVTVLKETTLSSSLLVRPDGMITMPLLGDVKAAGLTPLQLADDIAARLKKYIQDPNVSVILTQMNSKKVFLIGEITKVGPVELTPGMTLLEAIANGGGLTPYGNAKRMYILRTEDGKHTKIPVHYKAALKGYSDQNITLKPGDTIVVP